MIAIGVDVHKRLYSSSRLVTHGLLSLGLGWGEELGGGEVAEGLVGADGMVGMLPGLEFAIQGGDFESTGGDLIELLGVRTISAFDVAVEFSRVLKKAWGPVIVSEANDLSSLSPVGGEMLRSCSA